MRTIAALLLLASALVAQDTDPSRLIEQLGGDDIESRDRAEAALVKLGRPALATIEKALAGAEGEAKARLQRVVAAITRPRWTTDLSRALATAKAEKKPLFVFSTVGDLDGYA
jgi:hypothetical protein